MSVRIKVHLNFLRRHTPRAYLKESPQENHDHLTADLISRKYVMIMWKHKIHQSGEKKGENFSLQETTRATILEICNLYKLELESKNPNLTQSNNTEYQHSCQTKRMLLDQITHYSQWDYMTFGPT